MIRLSGQLSIVHVFLSRRNDGGGLVCSPQGEQYLFAADAVFGKLHVVAGAAVDVAPLGEEALRPDRPFAAETGETFVVPRVSFVLHALCTCRRHESDSKKQARRSEYNLQMVDTVNNTQREKFNVAASVSKL